MSERILVIGATGTIGRDVLQGLAGRGVPVRALSRRAGEGPREGISWVGGDLGDPPSLAPAFDGIDRVFLLTGNDASMVRLQKNAIRAAREAGAAHVVKLSALGASDHSRSLIGLWHWVVERALMESGMAWTVLRPHHFMQNLLEQRDAVAGEGVVRSAAGEGRIPFIDTRDIADVVVQALTEPGHAGRTHTLTGGEAISYRDATAILAEELGRPLRYLPEAPETAWPRLVAEGVPEWQASALLAIAAYQRAGGPTERTTDTVERIAGRPPRTFREFARDHAAHFRAEDGPER